jgi:plastocyanin domain-containing protein
MRKSTEAVASEDNLVIVSGGYKPERIVLKKGTPTTLEFLRNDENPCLEQLIIPDFDININLPLNKKTKFTITPETEGEFDFHCGMNMYFGKLIVK